ncbi:cytochrome P450 family protein [Rhizoctonia solani]|uniref:Cytochrome P450 family protein n=1 Tax=Rhizoctonia solani TaxID=456999 RepID=A0A8H8SZ42_9AGAM|nr:cytochrome P450 family protein [Rhizoctonia solani]QRW23936.1 cytochrome P450 family protein [Rhizoctonia solani]
MPITFDYKFASYQGKFVRIGPNHISIADPNALERVGCIRPLEWVLKSEFYEAFRIGRQDDVFTTQKKASHTTKRKRIANIFSAQNVQAFEPRVRTHVERLCAQLDLRCEQAMKGISGFNWEARGGQAVINMVLNGKRNGAAEGDGGSENRGVDLLDKLFEVKIYDGSPLSREEIDSEALVTIGAGSDTTSNSLSALCYHVASDARIKQKLQEELDSAFASTQKDVNDFASFEEIKNLPYLNACIKEAPVAFYFAGETFKEGSVISVPSYTTNRSNVWGSDAEMYRPERWLEDGSESLNKYYFAFSTGPRACIGRNLAHMDMMLSSAAFFRRYDVDLATPTTKLEIKEGFVRETVRCEVAIKRRI